MPDEPKVEIDRELLHLKLDYAWRWFALQRRHPETARHYEDLKRNLMARLASGSPAYNDGKTDFIESVVEPARERIA